MVGDLCRGADHGSLLLLLVERGLVALGGILGERVHDRVVTKSLLLQLRSRCSITSMHDVLASRCVLSLLQKACLTRVAGLLIRTWLDEPEG